MRIINKIKYILSNIYSWLVFLPANLKLARQKKIQLKNFKKYRKLLNKIYTEIIRFADNKFTTEHWAAYNKKIENELLPVPSFSFLNNKLIRQTMFVSGKSWHRVELDRLKKEFTENELIYLLKEELVGKPKLINSRYLTSENTIHHLYHLIKYKQFGGRGYENYNTIVEWGGGYGNMARLIRKLNKNNTYIIIDTPILCLVQWLYLSTVFTDLVHIITNKNNKIKLNKINIIPDSLIKSYDIKADLFISTWALSECEKKAQEYVFEKNWFNSPRYLLAYQESNTSLPDAGNLGKIAAKNGARIEEIPFLKNNFYAFK